MQGLAMQKEQFMAQKDEQKEALAELEKATGKVYYAVGGAIVETPKEDAIKKLKEKHESVEMRLSIVNKQYDEVSKKEKTLRETITNALKDVKQ